MPNCPVCYTEYILNRDVTCSTCDFDLTPYLPAIGNIPDSYLAKEKAKLQWSQNIWQQVREGTSLSAVNAQLQSQIDRLQYEIGNRDNEIDKLKTIEVQYDHTVTRVIALEQEIDEQTKIISSRLQTNVQLQSQVERLQNEIGNRDNEIDILKNIEIHYSQAATQVTALEQKIEAQAKIISSQSEANVQLQSQIDRLQSESNNLTKQITELETKQPKLTNSENNSPSPRLKSKHTVTPLYKHNSGDPFNTFHQNN